MRSDSNKVVDTCHGKIESQSSPEPLNSSISFTYFMFKSPPQPPCMARYLFCVVVLKELGSYQVANSVLYCYTNVCCLVAQSRPTLFDPMDYSPPGSSVHGISQARILEWVAIFFSRGSSQPRYRTHISYVGGWFLYHWALREASMSMYYIPSSIDEESRAMSNCSRSESWVVEDTESGIPILYIGFSQVFSTAMKIAVIWHMLRKKV